MNKQTNIVFRSRKLNKLEQRIHIIGSCATRDIFNILNKDDLVGRYTARSSLISRISSPLKFDFSSHLNFLNSSWQKKMLQQDFAKNGLYLDDYIQGLLLIDFIDERHQLLKIDNTFVTKSTEFVRCELDKVLEINEVISRGKQQDFDLWADACQKITKLIPEEIRQKTILHKAFWANTYLQDGIIKTFENQEKIIFFNKNLDYYYKTFESIYLPGCVIEVNAEQRIADANHHWDLAPFHYIQKYYKECYLKIINFAELQNL